MKHRSFIALIVGAMFIMGCSVIVPQPRPTIPVNDALPPPVTISSAEALSDAPSFNPNVVVPQRDPDIITLINNVSEQSLIAYVQQLQDFGTRNSYSDTEREDFGIGATRRWLFSEFERVGQGRLEVEFQDFPLTLPEAPTTTQRNVVATLPGVGEYPGVLVIGAHYDSRVGELTDGTSLSPSANDNASGVAMLLELARLMSYRNWQQTIVFVAFAAEEQGTAGSRYFANNALAAGVDIDFAMSNDGIGGRPGIPRSVRLFAPEIATSDSGSAARYITTLNQLYQPEFPITVINALDRAGRYGDQREFHNVGVGAIRLIESQEDSSLLNSTRDTWDRIDYAYLANVAKINLVVAASWAGGPPPPERPVGAPMAEQGSYLVNWSRDLQAVSYAVSFRPLDSLTFPDMRYVSAAEAGQTVFAGLDPNGTYAVSIAPIGLGGRLGGFSPEIICDANGCS